eukprot:tig00001067_g6765.t1
MRARPQAPGKLDPVPHVEVSLGVTFEASVSGDYIIYALGAVDAEAGAAGDSAASDCGELQLELLVDKTEARVEVQSWRRETADRASISLEFTSDVLFGRALWMRAGVRLTAFSERCAPLTVVLLRERDDEFSRTHFRVNTKRSWACPACLRAFADAAGARRHWSAVHGDSEDRKALGAWALPAEAQELEPAAAEAAEAPAEEPAAAAIAQDDEYGAVQPAFSLSPAASSGAGIMPAAFAAEDLCPSDDALDRASFALHLKRTAQPRGALPQGDTERGPEEEEAAAAPGELRCGECQREFRTAGGLASHERLALHAACPVCAHRFRSAAGCRHHLLHRHRPLLRSLLPRPEPPAPCPDAPGAPPEEDGAGPAPAAPEVPATGVASLVRAARAAAGLPLDEAPAPSRLPEVAERRRRERRLRRLRQAENDKRRAQATARIGGLDPRDDALTAMELPALRALLAACPPHFLAGGKISKDGRRVFGQAPGKSVQVSRYGRRRGRGRSDWCPICYEHVPVIPPATKVAHGHLYAYKHYWCPICMGKRFAHAFSLRRHIRACHQGHVSGRKEVSELVNKSHYASPWREKPRGGFAHLSLDFIKARAAEDLFLSGRYHNLVQLIEPDRLRAIEPMRGYTYSVGRGQRVRTGHLRLPAVQAPMEARVTSALCLAVLPGAGGLGDEEGYEAIQAVRRRYDRQVDRWPPHINLLYPFGPEAGFEQLHAALVPELRPMEPFDVTLDTFGFFQHAQSCTLFLAPSSEETKELLRKLQSNCYHACSPLVAMKPADFNAHLTVGQFPAEEELQAALAALTASWVPVRVRVTGVAMMARPADGSGPFRLLRQVPLEALVTLGSTKAPAPAPAAAAPKPTPTASTAPALEAPAPAAAPAPEASSSSSDVDGEEYWWPD